MRAELLTIGSELMSGATLNTNAAYLGRRLGEHGFACQRHLTVGDERPALVGAIREALPRGELLILTGGLGPTFDDITMDAVAEATGRRLLYAPQAARTIRRFYTRRHRRLQRVALRQAWLPRGGTALANPLGTAPGLWLELPPNRLLIALPGVPREMQAIFEQEVAPRLRRRHAGAPTLSRTLRTAGIVELSIERLLRNLRLPLSMTVGLYPSLRMVDVRLTTSDRSLSRARKRLADAESKLRRRLGDAVYGADEESLEGVIGARLVRRRLSLAVAESCTGGLLSDRLTNVPGSSRYFRGGVVAYHNDIKRTQLGVSARTLAQGGAVSAQTAQAMAQGVRQRLGADIGISITGVAGPNGGSIGKPIGLVYLGLADHRRARSQRYRFFGDRLAIKHQAVQACLDWLRHELPAAEGDVG